MKYTGITKGNLKPKLFLLLFPIIVVAGVLIFFANSKLGEDQDIQRSEASSTDVELFLETTLGTFELNEPTNIQVRLKTGTSKVTAIDTIIRYKSDELEIKDISFGDDFPVILSPAKYEDNLIKFTIGCPVASGGKVGDYTIATISVLPKKLTSSSSISFGPATIVTAVGSTTSVLSNSHDQGYEIIQNNTPEESCGNMDNDNNGIVDMYDFTSFVDMYQKNCTQATPHSTCGGKDSNNDSIIDIQDFSEFASIYKRECSSQ